jgi:hypothetical protein
MYFFTLSRIFLNIENMYNIAHIALRVAHQQQVTEPAFVAFSFVWQKLFVAVTINKFHIHIIVHAHMCTHTKFSADAHIS